MKKIKILITFLAIILSIATVKGQDNMIINLAIDSNVSILMGDIQRITFDNNNMLLKTVNGIENNYLLDDIVFITFLDNSDNPNVIEQFTENSSINIYMNEYGVIIVESPSEIRMLSIFDINGKIVQTTTNSNNINVSFLIMGTYLLRVETTQGTVTKKFIKNR